MLDGLLVGACVSQAVVGLAYGDWLVSALWTVTLTIVLVTMVLQARMHWPPKLEHEWGWVRGKIDGADYVVPTRDLPAVRKAVQDSGGRVVYRFVSEWHEVELKEAQR
jgi:hypothetical protein